MVLLIEVYEIHHFHFKHFKAIQNGRYIWDGELPFKCFATIHCSTNGVSPYWHIVRAQLQCMPVKRFLNPEKSKQVTSRIDSHRHLQSYRNWSTRQNKYFINNYSRFSHIYLLSTRDQIAETFYMYKAFVENKPEHHIRCDNASSIDLSFLWKREMLLNVSI